MAGLGRGLSSLLSECSKSKERSYRDGLQNNISSTSVKTENNVFEIDISKLKPSEYQPRKAFDDEKIDELALSIKEHGLLEPLLVKKENNGFYAIICGERRFRACKKANLDKIPCLVRDDLKESGYALALIENIQREDLNPLELAEALNIMLKECSLNQDELAKTLGKSRSSVTNLLRLNNLDPKVKKHLSEGRIDFGHARALLSLDNDLQSKAADIVIKKSLSVRQTEYFVKKLKSDDSSSSLKKHLCEKIDPNKVDVWEKNISSKFNGLKVKISESGKNKGKLTISFDSEDQLNNILGYFNIDNI